MTTKLLIGLLLAGMAWESTAIAADAPPIAVTVTFTGVGSIPTDAAGNFSATVPTGYTGTATPSAPGFVFSPLSLQFSQVTDDLAGNTFLATDVQPPSISITYPAGSLPRGAVVLICKATDNWYVKQVAWYVDGSLIGSAAMAPFSMAWNAATVKGKGWHTLSATATDGQNNTATAIAQFRIN